MKSDPRPNSDDLALLREWEVKDPLPPRFSEQVWRRIARQEAQAGQSLWSRISGWLSLTLARPALATSYLTVLLAVGAAGGYWHARMDNARVSGELGARYVQMMEAFSGERR